MEETPGTTSGTARRCDTCGATYPPDFAVCPRDATPLAEMAAAAPDPLIGVVLAGTYRIVRVLGEGGMARLFLAEHVRLEGRYAVKVIHEDLAKDPALLARFEREARAAARIQSPHVLGVIDVVRTADQRPCIVAELLEGEDLQAYLDRIGGKAALEMAIPIVRQVCRALDAAHQRGVVHRDLKPSNVFLCRQAAGEPLVKVLDFGVAKLAGDRPGAELTRTGVVVGTPAYMAPEQAQRASEAGPLADVYAVGALLYRMLTGEPPYGHDPPVSAFVLLLHEDPMRPREIDASIPEGVESVIQHAMARDPAVRPRSVLELDAELAAFDAGPSTALAPAGRAEAIARSARLARPAAALLVGASILASELYAAALLSSILGGPASGTERGLIIVAAAGAAIGVGVLLIRALRACWRSAPAVLRLVQALARTLTAGAAGLGLMELISGGADAMSRPTPSSSEGFPWRLVVAGIAAAVGAVWPKLVSRLTRRDS
jgi:serine/threonine-protein kinase